MSVQVMLDFNPPAIPVNKTVHPDEVKRLSGQCGQILERLRQGWATNRELAEISMKYTGRISDLRAAGYDIRVLDRDYKTGITIYALYEGEL